MPDPDRLSPEKRKALLGCVKAKNKKWSKSHNGKKVPSRISRKHFSDCARATGVENSWKNQMAIFSSLDRGGSSNDR